jgi:predicted O-methyltransferase YrrM
VSEQDSNWKYADQIVNEAEPIARARRHALEMGIEPISPAVGAQSALIAAATNAQNIVEIGTGTGVSGLWLLSATPRAVLTSIEAETELQSVARQSFLDAGIAPNRVRLITGRALDVLPRMNENSYDIVFVDGDPGQVIENVEHGLRLVRPGGTVLVPRALWRGRVSDPAQRDEVTTSFRTLVQEIAASDAVVAALSPVGDGLLQLTTRY